MKPQLTLEVRTDSPDESGMQTRDPCRPWRAALDPGHKPRLGLFCPAVTLVQSPAPPRIPKTDSLQVSRSLLTRGLLSWAGGNGSPAHRLSLCVKCFLKAAVTDSRTIYSCAVLSPFSPPPGAITGSQGRAGLWATRRGLDCQLHGAQAFRTTGKMPESTAVTKGACGLGF